MEPDHDQACYIFGDVVDRMFGRLVAITNTYAYVSRSIDFSADQIVLQDVDEFGALALDPELVRYFPNREEIINGTYRHRVGKVVFSELQTAKRRVASASLVFAHTIFEECVMDCLRIAFTAKPSDWIPLVDAKKVSFSEICRDGIPQLQKERIESLIKVLDRDSLMKKLEVFFNVTRPAAGSANIRDYQYDRERIERIDRARHTAAHDDPAAYDPEDLKGDVDYFRITTMYLLAVLIDRYDVRNMQRPEEG